MTITTPGFTLTAETVRRLVAVVGDDAVHLEDADRDQYRDPYWYQGDRTYDSSAVVYPTSTEQVQQIVRIASDAGVPIWTSSQGRNNGYGGPSPRVKGSILLSFRRMDKVLEINRELAYAVVEPGVRWFDLVDALEASGNEDLIVSIPDIGWGSVVGNTLDSGGTYLPYGMDFQAATGMEVVLANGELLRTGMGGVPGNKSWHLYKRGLGPVLDPLFVQSNYGIVTRMGYWLMRRPEAYAPLYLTIPRGDQLEQAVDIIRELRLSGVLRGVPCFYNIVSLAWQFPELGEYLGGKGALSEEQLQELADGSGLGRWGFRAALWGDGPVVEHQLAKITEAWSALEGSRIVHDRTFTKDEWGPFESFTEKVHAGVPTMDMMNAVPDGIGHLAFSPVIPIVGKEVAEFERLASEFIRENLDENLSAGVIVTNERSLIFICNLSLVLDDEAQVRRARDTLKKMVEHFGALGYGEYRAHLDIMDLASDQFSFGDHSYRRFCEAIKDAVDPKGILSPGRHGIWPAAYRE